MKLILSLAAAIGLCLTALAQVPETLPNLPAASSLGDADLTFVYQASDPTRYHAATLSSLKTYFAAGGTYTLPVASPSVLGGVKQGSNIAITGDGTISVPSLAFSLLTGTPTTLAGYGITDPVVETTGSYANPSWITSLSYTKVTGRPFGGTQAIASGADSVTVTGLGLSSAPSLVLVTTQKVSGNLNIFATVRSDSITSSGFIVDLSGVTDGSTYTLNFLVVP